MLRFDQTVQFEFRHAFLISDRPAALVRSESKLSGFPERGSSHGTTGHLLRGGEGRFGLGPAVDFRLYFHFLNGHFSRCFRRELQRPVRQHFTKIAGFDPCREKDFPRAGEFSAGLVDRPGLNVGEMNVPAIMAVFGSTADELGHASIASVDRGTRQACPSIELDPARAAGAYFQNGKVNQQNYRFHAIRDHGGHRCARVGIHCPL
jgi:hypothetical protein